MPDNRQRAGVGGGKAVAKLRDAGVKQVFGFLRHAVGVFGAIVPPDIGQVVEIKLGEVCAQMGGAAAHIAAVRQMFDRACGDCDGGDAIKDDLGGLDSAGQGRADDVLDAKICGLIAGGKGLGAAKGG